ncbi:MAG: hypothetical protein Q4F17_02685 [Eubacteriales bacterium]|nr:hypothetical protein [Eubacteriales bacterium]
MGTLLLILDSKTALAGAKTGVTLCISTVIPALFPFLVLSAMVMGTSFGVLGPLGRLCCLPKGAENLLIPAFLGGYPVGARTVARAWREGRLNRREAEGLLGFCSHAGPSFIFGMGAVVFPAGWMSWALWGIHLASGVLTARLLGPVGDRAVSLDAGKGPTLSGALSQALSVMGLICGWVVLFRVVIAFLSRWVLFLLPAQVQILIVGLLELTNGCCVLPLVEDTALRFTLCSGMLAAGGLCVLMQTASVTAGLSLRRYCLGKAIQTALSLLLCGCLFRGKYVIVPTALLVLALLMKKQKRAGIPARSGI